MGGREKTCQLLVTRGWTTRDTDTVGGGCGLDREGSGAEHKGLVSWMSKIQIYIWN